MRDEKGRFIKGQHYSVATEFKKGQKASPYTQIRKGIRFSKETEFGRGHIPWNKGLKGTHFSPNTEFKRKNENLSYGGIHTWIRKKLGKASYCKFDPSHLRKRYTWANISGEYKEDLSDFMPLCYSCHKIYDLGRHKSKP